MHWSHTSICRSRSIFDRIAGRVRLSPHVDDHLLSALSPLIKVRIHPTAWRSRIFVLSVILPYRCPSRLSVRSGHP